MKLRQVPPLARAFVVRFFENELTSGSSDLRTSFFWLVAVLAPVGLVMPWIMVFSYTEMFFRGGHDLVRILSMADKTLYVGFGMVSTGAVSVVVWNAMLIDRRDALVLGALPVSGSTIVLAKLASLVAYVGLIAVGTHAMASVSFAFVLGNWGGCEFFLRGIPAHFIASCLGSAFVLFAVAGLQGLLLSVVGPRVFARVSPVLQLALAAVVLFSFILLPMIAGSVIDTVGARPDGVGARPGAAHAWILATPPLWFLGIYETILGDPVMPVMGGLAMKAFIAVGSSLGVVLLVYPFAYRRLAPAAVENTDAPGPRGAGVPLSERIARWTSREPRTRAAVHFMLAAMGRVERHRITLAIAGGLVAVLALPSMIAASRGLGPASLPRLTLLSAPIGAMAVLLLGLRTAAALPADAKAAWMFALIDPPSPPSRAGLARVLWLFGVAAPLLVFLPFLVLVFGPVMAAVNSALMIAAGAVLIEALLINASAVPCSQAWRPESLNLRGLWPIYLLGFFSLTRLVPSLTWFSQGHLRTPALFCVAMLSLAWALHIRSRRVLRSTYPETDLPPALQVLDL